MSTRRDYKPRKGRGRRKKKPVSAGLWLTTGLAVGLFVALLTYLSDRRQNAEPEVAVPAPPSAVTPEPQPEPAPRPVPEAKPRYDFYAILPNREINIPEEELAPPGTRASPAYQGPWMLQAGSFRGFQDADRLKASLAFQGLESRIDLSENSNGTWHRVRLGPFESKRQADRIKSKLAKLNIHAIILKSRP